MNFFSFGAFGMIAMFVILTTGHKEAHKMSLRQNTPCDIDGICPYNAECNGDCEYWCGADEPDDYEDYDGYEDFNDEWG